MDPKQTVELLSIMSTNYYNFELTEERIALWIKHMEDMPADLAFERLNEHIQSNKFPPTVADIVRLDPSDQAIRRLYFGELKEEAMEDHIRNGGNEHNFDHAGWERRIKHEPLPNMWTILNSTERVRALPTPNDGEEHEGE